ncbi:hypothetical protein PN836_020255 [Ningiella sp. W23]|uniref:hypothetical protein n=1 Tax=Ningiella sp. W23 TaxID=3023715 RepID=UPI003757D60A
MLTEGLQKAIENLFIKDVAFDLINASKFGKEFNFVEGNFHIQQKFGLKSLEVKELDDQRMAHFTFEAGVRWISDENSHDDGSDELSDKELDIIAHVECTITAIYALKIELDKEALDEFGMKNSGIHVWPYWREFLTTSCDRLRLPRVMLPMTQFQAVPEQKDED